MTPVTTFQLPSQTVRAAGNSEWFPAGIGSLFALDLNVSAIRGSSTPGITFFLERLAQDGNAYPVYSPSAKTSTGQITQSIGPGLETTKLIYGSVRLRWTITGSAMSTTVTTGANSVNQVLGNTANMVAGDTLHFATANVDRTIVTVVDGTHVTLDSAVNSTTNETVTVSNTPDFTFTANLNGK